MRYLMKNLGEGVMICQDALNEVMQEFPEGAPIGFFTYSTSRPLPTLYVVIDTVYYHIPTDEDIEEPETGVRRET